MNQNTPRVHSVQPQWCLALPIQQQSVLLLAARGPDGIAKFHPCKEIQRAYRATVLVAAKYGREITFEDKPDTFMNLNSLRNEETWNDAVDTFFNHADDLAHHFLMHLLHGAEILGYKHPRDWFRRCWGFFYRRGCHEFHLNLETEAQMNARLCDWDQEHWS